MSITHHSQQLPHNPQCPQCCWDLDFMGNEEYGDNGQKYLYHCPHCGAELGFTNLWKKINLNIHFGNDKSNFSKSRPYLSRSKQVFEIAVSAKLDSKLSEGYRW